MKEINDQPKENDPGRRQLLKEDDGKKTPPAHTGKGTGGEQPSTRPEHEPDVPPHERTAGIP